MNTFPTSIIPENENIQKISGKLILADKFMLDEADKEALMNFFHENIGEQFYYYLASWMGRKLFGNTLYYRDKALLNAVDSNGYSNIASTEDSLIVHELNPESASIVFPDDYLPQQGTLLVCQQFDGDGDYLKIYNENTEILIKIQDSLLIISAKSSISDEIISKSIQIKTKKYIWTNQQYEYICYSISYSKNKIFFAQNNIALELKFKQDIDTESLNLDAYKNIYDLVISEYFSDKEFVKGFTEMLGNSINFTFGTGVVNLSEDANVYIQANHRISALFSQKELSPELRGNNYKIQLKLQEV